MKQIWIISGVLMLALVAVGCSNQSSNGTQAGVVSAGKSATTGTTTTETKEKAAVRSSIGKYGKVKKIIGNSVTIALAEIPKKTEKEEGATTGKTSGTTADAPKEGDIPPGGEPPSGGGAPPSGGGGGTAGSQGGGATGGSSGMKGSFGLNTEALDLTGEVVELLIPVGVKITTAGTGGMKEIDFADILQGDTIALYYVEGTENIQRVVITPSTTD